MNKVTSQSMETPKDTENLSIFNEQSSDSDDLRTKKDSDHLEMSMIANKRTMSSNTDFLYKYTKNTVTHSDSFQFHQNNEGMQRLSIDVINEEHTF